ncbi:MAG: 3-phosphoshikimate 1-carboxyvinyltransferase [Phycisphaerales bacterium]
MPGRPEPPPPSLLDLPDLSPAALPPVLHVPPLARPFDAVVRPPGSKSITNRVLLLAALATGESVIHGALVDADDAQVMIEALRRLGAEVGVEASAGTQPVVRVRGVAGRWKLKPGEAITLNLHNAGTATRFLAAAALLTPPGASIIIDGNERMRQRPIGELADLLKRMGASAEFLGTPGCPPVRIAPPADFAALAGELEVGRTQSSQFVSALALVAPLLPRGLTLRLPDGITSEPYVAMTTGVLERLGVVVRARTTSAEAGREISIRPLAGVGGAGAVLHGFTFNVEPDLSSASYFWAAAAMIPGAKLRIDGYPDPDHGATLQGDGAFLTLALDGPGTDTFGCGVAGGVVTGPAHLRAASVDCAGIPDTAMTAAVLACFASPTSANPTATSRLRGLRTLRVKETDRLAALQTELTKLGAAVEIETTAKDEALVISPPRPPRDLPDALGSSASEPKPVVFDTYDDHRMAMSLALVGLRRKNVFIRNPACVAKTYPTYWRDLKSLYGGKLTS